MLKIAHIGYGGMGQAVQAQALKRGHETVSVIDVGDEISEKSLNQADIAIECTIPSAFEANFTKLCELKQNTLIITTGWYEDLPKYKKMAEKAGIKVLWSSNYSIGVNLYFRIIEAAAKLVNQTDEYDIWGHEIHHFNKVDSPSGTAKTLEEIILKNVDRKTSVVEETLQRKIKPEELHFTATRGGAMNFAHTIALDSESDCIEIKHVARNRDGYALGAVKAAEWLSQKPPGFYSMDNFLEDMFKN